MSASSPSARPISQPKAAAASVPAMLAQPLILQAAAMRRPHFSVQASSPEFTEEGDILHSVMCNPTVSSPPRGAFSSGSGGPPIPPPGQAWGLQPALCLPSSVGTYLKSETFSAMFSLFNSATYPLTNLHIEADGFVVLSNSDGNSSSSGGGGGGGRQQQGAVLLTREVSSLAAKQIYTLQVDMPLRAVGPHTLALVVNFSDPSGAARRFNWATTFGVEQAITELPEARIFRRVPVACPPTTTQDSDRAVDHRTNVYALSVTLQNTCSVPVTLKRARIALGADGTHGEEDVFRLATSDGFGSIAAAGALLRPRDSVVCTFELSTSCSSLRSAAVLHSGHAQKKFLLPPKLMNALGHLEWHWERADAVLCDATRLDASGYLRLSMLTGLPEMDVRVCSVAPADAAQHHPLAGYPVRLCCEMVHHAATAGGSGAESDNGPETSVALKLRPELMAPHWLCAGASLRVIGVLPRGGLLRFTVDLCPRSAGWLPIQRGALELVDASHPEHVLWPLPHRVLEASTAAGTVLSTNTNNNNSHSDGGASPLSSSAVPLYSVMEEQHADDEARWLAVLVR